MAGALLAVIALLAVPVSPASASSDAVVQLVSVSNGPTAPAAAVQPASRPSLSGDGRFVVFSSIASNLSPLANGFEQVYLRDLTTGTTQLISAVGAVAGIDASTEPTISADGSAVAFATRARNLVPGSGAQIAVWSRATNSIHIASVTGGTTPQPGDRDSDAPVISGDGRTVAFRTSSTNLSPLRNFGQMQLYSRDLQAATTALISKDTTAAPETGSPLGVSPTISISTDGTKVAFVTQAQLTAAPTAGVNQIYLFTRAPERVELMSVNRSGTVGANADAIEPSLSADGEVLAFSSRASDLPETLDTGFSAIYSRRIATAITTMASRNLDGSPVVGNTSSPALSANGSVLAFISDSPTIVPEAIGYPTVKQSYTRNLSTGDVNIASPNLEGTGGALMSVSDCAISNDGSRVAFRSTATNLSAIPHDPDHSQVFVSTISATSNVTRLSGPDRYSTAATLSAGTFPSYDIVGGPAVFIATGQTFPDALSASAAAGIPGAAVLLVEKNRIPDDVLAELRRLRPRYISVIGGTNSIDDSVFATLTSLKMPIFRIDGASRFDVSAKLSEFVTTSSTRTAYVASGETFPDALAGSAAAGHDHAPVLLTNRDSVPAPILAELARLAPSKIVVLGGSSTITDGVVATLNGIAATTRIAGVDRYDGSAVLSRATFPGGSRTVYIASGEGFPDALAGGAAAIHRGGPLLLVNRDGIPVSVATELDRLNPTKIIVLGGSNTVSDGVMSALDAYLAR